MMDIKSTIEDSKVKDKIRHGEKEALYEKCQDTLEWLEENQVI